MVFALLAKRFGKGVECAKQSHDIYFFHFQSLVPPVTQGTGVRGLFGTKTGITPTIVTGAKGIAACLGYRPHAWNALGNRNAYIPLCFTLYADTVGGYKGPSAM
jgi:hypothetical protein